MDSTCCLVAVAAEDIPRLSAALTGALGHAEMTVALLDVPVLNALAPDVLVIDIDRLDTDPIESLRRLRFVLADCVIVAFTDSTRPSFMRKYHNAGANCLISKSSDERQIAAGLREALRSGCFTDPPLVA